ncbi:MAG: TraB/GumN family protein [Bacteroidota bacterium]
MKNRNIFLSFLVTGVTLITFLGGCKGTKQAASPAATSSVAEEKALLWKISGKDLTQDSYLYGTIHIIGAKDFVITDEVKSAFAATDKLVLELDMDDPKMMMTMMSGAMMKDGKTLKDLISAEDYQMVSDFFRDSVGMPLMAVEKMMPMLALSSIYPKMLGDKTESYELSFMKMAKKAEKEVLGVESIEDQLAIFSEISYEDQAAYLVDYLKKFDYYRSEFRKMVDLYVARDLPGLYDFMMSFPEMEGQEEAMLDNRNKKWIPVMEEMAATQSNFFAVGAGHLPGEQGVISLLRKAGYTLTPVQ